MDHKGKKIKSDHKEGIGNMSSDLGKVSVIVPVYNVEKYFDECINSILHQTYQNLEIIIVDDGTKDNCGKKADEFAKQDERITVIHKENGGLARARNTGMKHATGEYYCFIDSDDYIEPEYVEKLLNALIKHDAGMVFCNYYSCYPNKNIPSHSLSGIEDGKQYSPEDFLRKIYTTYSGSFSFAWNKMYKKEIFQDLEFKPILCEDVQIMLPVADRAGKIVFVSDALYYYRRRKSSLANNNREALLFGDISWINDHLEGLKATGRDDLYNILQKLYIKRLIEKYHLCSRKTRKEKLKPLLRKEMKEFMNNSEISGKTRFKCYIQSLMPYIYGKIKFRNVTTETYWD